MRVDKNSSSKSSTYVSITTPRVTHKQAEGSTHLSRDPRTRIEKLGYKMEATANKTEQNRALQQPIGTYDQEVRTSEPRSRLNRRYCQNFWPLPEHTASRSELRGRPRKNAHGSTLNFRSVNLPNQLDP
jgi:hypothetical protein